MEKPTSIRKMISNNSISVPTYQRAYSWETPFKDKTRKTHIDVFLKDLEDHIKSETDADYYFGHFLFEAIGLKNEVKYHIIDGQQRLTTIVIFTCVIISKLKEMWKITSSEEDIWDDIIEKRGNVRFSTVDYDNQLFKDYVIYRKKKDHSGIETESAERIVHAYDFFQSELSKKTAEELKKLLSVVCDSGCTTHIVKNQSEAIQMFIFQNNRGKKPTNLEIVKAKFMYHMHLYGREATQNNINEISARFSTIYKALSKIEGKIDEDDILTFTTQVYFNSLWETDVNLKIDQKLSDKNSVSFVLDFSNSLACNFSYISEFYDKSRENFIFHSLAILGRITIAFPFIIKAFIFKLSDERIGKLCTAFESLVLRNKIIGTRADLRGRINEVFQKFSENSTSIDAILNKIQYLKTTEDWWWAYWADTEFSNALRGAVSHGIAKYLLWKYENNLESMGKNGYKPTRYDAIDGIDLEHIAPVTEPIVKPHGYDVYDEKFRNEYLNCLGNYLLLSGSHNRSIGNGSFPEKRATYSHNYQQREVVELTQGRETWCRDLIKERHEKIVNFILNNY